MRTNGLPVAPLGEKLSKALSFEQIDPATGPKYPCRPVVARSGERHTAYGSFVGQIGLATVTEFKSAMHDLVSENLVKVILDFSGVSLTKSAVGALVGFAANMHGRNKQLYLYRISPQVKSVLKELKLLAFFHFLETEDDVLSTLAV